MFKLIRIRWEWLEIIEHGPSGFSITVQTETNSESFLAMTEARPSTNVWERSHASNDFKLRHVSKSLDRKHEKVSAAMMFRILLYVMMFCFLVK